MSRYLKNCLTALLLSLVLNAGNATSAHAVPFDEGFYSFWEEALPLDKIQSKYGIAISREALAKAGSSIVKFQIPSLPGYSTGSFVSSQGLIITHSAMAELCLQGYQEKHANFKISEEGFFAKHLTEEVPCPGMVVTRVHAESDVTNEIESTFEIFRSLISRPMYGPPNPHPTSPWDDDVDWQAFQFDEPQLPLDSAQSNPVIGPLLPKDAPKKVSPLSVMVSHIGMEDYIDVLLSDEYSALPESGLDPAMAEDVKILKEMSGALKSGQFDVDLEAEGAYQAALYKDQVKKTLLGQPSAVTAIHKAFELILNCEGIEPSKWNPTQYWDEFTAQTEHCQLKRYKDSMGNRNFAIVKYDTLRDIRLVAVPSPGALALSKKVPPGTVPAIRMDFSIFRAYGMENGLLPNVRMGESLGTLKEVATLGSINSVLTPNESNRPLNSSEFFLPPQFDSKMEEGNFSMTLGHPMEFDRQKNYFQFKILVESKIPAALGNVEAMIPSLRAKVYELASDPSPKGKKLYQEALAAYQSNLKFRDAYQALAKELVQPNYLERRNELIQEIKLAAEKNPEDAQAKTTLEQVKKAQDLTEEYQKIYPFYFLVFEWLNSGVVQPINTLLDVQEQIAAISNKLKSDEDRDELLRTILPKFSKIKSALLGIPLASYKQVISQKLLSSILVMARKKEVPVFTEHFKPQEGIEVVAIAHDLLNVYPILQIDTYPDIELMSEKWQPISPKAKELVSLIRQIRRIFTAIDTKMKKIAKELGSLSEELRVVDRYGIIETSVPNRLPRFSYGTIRGTESTPAVMKASYLKENAIAFAPLKSAERSLARDLIEKLGETPYLFQSDADTLTGFDFPDLGIEHEYYYPGGMALVDEHFRWHGLQVDTNSEARANVFEYSGDQSARAIVLSANAIMGYLDLNADAKRLKEELTYSTKGRGYFESTESGKSEWCLLETPKITGQENKKNQNSSGKSSDCSTDLIKIK